MEADNKWDSVIQRRFKRLLRNIKGKQDRKTYEERLQTLIELLPWLRHSGGVYPNPRTAASAQQLFMSVWEYLLSIVDTSPYTDRAYLFEAIIAIMRRSEFDVGQLKFNEDMQPECTSAELAIFKQFRRLLLATHEFVTRKLIRPGSYASLSKFTAQVLATNFYLLPNCGQLIVTSVWPKSLAAKITENHPNFEKDVVFGVLHEDEDEDFSDHQGVALEQWMWLFQAIDPIPSDEIPALINATVSDENTWLGKLAKREGFFFEFCYEWLTHTRQLLRRYQLPRWTCVYGYGEITRSVLAVLVDSPSLSNIPPRFVDASNALAYNNRCLSVMIKFSFLRTSLFDTQGALDCLHLISTWLSRLAERGDVLAIADSRFDMQTFQEAIFLLLKSNHHVLILRTMLLLYDRIQVFPQGAKSHLIAQLFERFFFQLYNHWDSSVRASFHHFIIYKLVSRDATAEWLERWRDASNGANINDDNVLALRRLKSIASPPSFPPRHAPAAPAYSLRRTLEAVEGAPRTVSVDLPRQPMTLSETHVQKFNVDGNGDEDRDNALAKMVEMHLSMIYKQCVRTVRAAVTARQDSFDEDSGSSDDEFGNENRHFVRRYRVYGASSLEEFVNLTRDFTRYSHAPRLDFVPVNPESDNMPTFISNH